MHCHLNRNQSQKWNIFSISPFGPFTEPNDRFPTPFIYTSTSKIPTPFRRNLPEKAIIGSTLLPPEREVSWKTWGIVTSRLFGFHMKNSFDCLIHGNDFVCFLDTFIYYWVWGKFLQVTKNFVYAGQQRRFLRNFWWVWLAALVCYRHRSTPLHARGKNLWYPTSIGRCSRNIGVVT